MRAFMRFSPLRARNPSTLTDSPIFTSHGASRALQAVRGPSRSPVRDSPVARPSRDVEPHVRVGPVAFVTMPVSLMGSSVEFGENEWARRGS